MRTIARTCLTVGPVGGLPTCPLSNAGDFKVRLNLVRYEWSYAKFHLLPPEHYK